MIDRPDTGSRAIAVDLNVNGYGAADGDGEFEELCLSAGATIVGRVWVARSRPEAKYFIGAGKAEELRAAVAASEADLIIVNHSLSAAQERNLERLTECRVVDRIGIILDIFAQRAQTFEGKLQVELAQLRHLSTRLVRGWSHLERQKGGIGLRGPGEKQLETDRRLLGVRIRQIAQRLDQVQRRRDVNRRSRARHSVPVVSLVGYTNAGKSSLFNQITGAGVFAEDKLFATLDPTLRRVERPGQPPFVLADTVGFVRDLPHELVAAFRSTLEEVRQSSLLLHVVDAASEARADHQARVDEVLAEIEADGIPQLVVFNKIDCLDDVAPRVERDADGRPRRIWVSARTGAGVDVLLEAIDELVAAAAHVCRLRLTPAQGRLRASFFRSGQVLEEQLADNGDHILKLRINPELLRSLCRREGTEPASLAVH